MEGLEAGRSERTEMHQHQAEVEQRAGHAQSGFEVRGRRKRRYRWFEIVGIVGIGIFVALLGVVGGFLGMWLGGAAKGCK